MVKAEDALNMADGWREVFERSRVVPPPSQTVRLALDNHFTQSHGFQLTLSRLTAAHLPQSQEMSGGGQDVTHQLRVTLFDRNHQHFFGKTWRSPPQRMKNNKISLNEVLYFHTSLRLPSAVMVLELVSLSDRPDGSQQALGRGFTVLELFTNRPEVQASDGVQRLNLHHGSPRSLLHPLLKDTVDYGSLLKTIDGAHLDCVIKKHPALAPAMHLLPENVLLSGNENVPGLAASPTGDALLRPQLLKTLPFTLNRLTISLQPSLEKFESQLLQLINADCHNTLSATSAPRAAFLQCLRWGIWCPFQEPADWKGEEIQLVLRGGAEPNPHGVMAYSTEMFANTQSPAPLSAAGSAQLSPLPEAKDTITFRLSSSLERKASSPKASLRTKQEDVSRHRRSPSQGQRSIPPASPPESPQGPGLSLSQLAATSRYPTISHSSSALPWQQSFPSLLHPSLLASAHQLSHVACSGVSNIAHLEMDLQREGDASQDEGDQLQELPFTPVHAPVITLGMNMPSSCSVSSRSSLAHLYSAGFPDIADSAGQAAEVLDPTEPVPFDPQREESGPLQGDLLVFQFLAFTRTPAAGVGPDWPENIHFTFQFYRFPPVTSQQLKLLASDKVQQKACVPLPCVLASINRDGTVNSGPPGLQVQFRADGGFLKAGEKRWFLRYLALHTMHIDIWDSDSLLLIGSTAVELKYMLRQGKSAVQALHELEVLTTDYVGEDALLTSAHVGRRPAISPMTVHSIVMGRLHIRTGNIGCPVDPSRRRAADVMASHSNIITPREVIGSFRGGSLTSRNILQLNARNAAQAHRLGKDGAHDLNEPDGGRRKLDCMAAVHRREGKEEAKVTDRTKEARLARELHQMKPSERHSKAEGIANMLSQAITTQHLLYANLGTAEYMEFVLKNPFNVPQTVTIHSDDPELRAITNTEEWGYFKALSKSPTPLEENMFHLEEGAPGPRVYLRPKESIHIPLKYQSFLCDHTMALQGPSFQPPGKGSQVAKKNLSNIVAAKTIKVTFTAEDGKPMAICQVNVEPTAHVVDQTFRLYHPELCFLKKAIRLPPWDDPTVGDPDVRTHISVRCSDPNIICQTRMLAPGEPQDVYLKVPGSPSPNIKMFFVMVFTDKWMAAPSQIWQIYVHFLERVDVSCVTGQRSCQSLVLRGKQAVRKVKCFSSHPQEIEVDPEGVFVLPPAAVQELQLKVQPWRAGSRFLYVNAVDVENRRLVTAWLLCLNVHRPVLSKAFEVCVPVGGGRGSSRKITYTNPYTNSRSFLLRSDHPDLLQFKEEKFQISGGESYTIGLRFAPSQSPGSVEILVYVNNLEEKTEETFCVKVNYS
ncbi:nephrocystin-4 isoform X3 [Cyclopterus lumpus]|uniref:nephrocystin-4 isoform X3 n=1 Tax=Cyclopterus lumpus TaxID=8103 RepID=UPI001485D68B|nr:nephrocystin-4 isoform X3 [Cyclopterus lumpus]